MGAEADAIRGTNLALREIIESIEREVLRLTARLNSEEGRLVSDKFNLGQVIRIREQVKALVEREAPILLARFGEGLPDIVEEVLETYPDLGIYAADITDDLVRTFERGAAEIAEVLQKEVAEEVTRGLRLSLIGGADFEKLQKEIAQKLNTSRIRVSTLLASEIAGFQEETLRDVAKKRSELLGDTMYFLYEGPDDAETRDFCKQRVGKALPQEAADSLKGAQRERFNCRHILIPIDEETRLELDKEIYRGLA